MVSFDLSTTNILLTVAVVGLLAFFIFLLVKLNPSPKREENVEAETVIEEQMPRGLPPQVIQNPEPPPVRVDVPRVMERPLVAPIPNVRGSSGEVNQEVKPSVINQNREVPKQPEKTVVLDRNVATVKPGLGSGPSNKKDCFHHFGYLRTFPKNSPIPDECFGCERIVDCLVNKNHGRERR